MKPFCLSRRAKPAPRIRPIAFLRADDARHIVTHPELYAHRVILRRLAWTALMQARGHRVDQARIAAMPVQGVDTFSPGGKGAGRAR